MVEQSSVTCGSCLSTIALCRCVMTNTVEVQSMIRRWWYWWHLPSTLEIRVVALFTFGECAYFECHIFACSVAILESWSNIDNVVVFSSLPLHRECTVYPCGQGPFQGRRPLRRAEIRRCCPHLCSCFSSHMSFSSSSHRRPSLPCAGVDPWTSCWQMRSRVCLM